MLILYLKNLNMWLIKNGGETGIRTQERVAPLPVFKTGAFNRSAISPWARFYKYNFEIQLKMSFFQNKNLVFRNRIVIVII